MNHHSLSRKIVAVFAVLAFISLMYISTVPLQASTGQDEGPGAVEKTTTTVKKKGSPILPIIIGVVALGGIAAVLFLVVLKSYDIRGTWSVQGTWSGGSTFTISKRFSGEKKSGAVVIEDLLTGTYNVNGKDVSWTYAFIISVTYTGKFTDKDSMSGTMANTLGENGTWTATRVAKASIGKGDIVNVERSVRSKTDK